MSPRWNWDSPIPSLASECAPLPGTKGGGGHTRLRVRGWGKPNSDDWRKACTLPTTTFDLFAINVCMIFLIRNILAIK